MSLEITEINPYFIIMALFMLMYFVPMIYRWIMKNHIRTILMSIANDSKRSVVLMNHMSSGIFGSMITTDDLIKINNIINKLKGKPFDLIMHTPGGDLFASMEISKRIKRYGSKIRSFVPLYAMSGGTMIALATDEIHLGKNATLGPVDPQVGTIFGFFSAKAWKEIVRKKKNKAKDESIGMDMLGKQTTRTVQNFLRQLLPKNQKAIKKLTHGDVEHSYALDNSELDKIGIKTKTLDNEKMDKLIESCSKSKSDSTIVYHIYKQPRKRFWRRNT